MLPVEGEDLLDAPLLHEGGDVPVDEVHVPALVQFQRAGDQVRVDDLQAGGGQDAWPFVVTVASIPYLQWMFLL